MLIKNLLEHQDFVVYFLIKPVFLSFKFKQFCEIDCLCYCGCLSTDKNTQFVKITKKELKNVKI